MIDHRISGVPVIDAGRLVGIVGENDLLRRIELGTEATCCRNLDGRHEMAIALVLRALR